jgi:hypothetical protein
MKPTIWLLFSSELDPAAARVAMDDALAEGSEEIV